MQPARSLGPARLRWADPCAAAACLFALSCAVWSLRDLTWPGMEDFARDMATAQYFLETGRLADPFYAGEELWYPPMAPLATALAARVSGLSVPEAAARCGPWLNLLGPIAFYMLASYLLGRLAGLGALACYLFLAGGDRPWFVVATYSPWLVPFNFAQGFFFLSVLALLRARTSTGLLWHVTAGILAGITFLTHVVPAVILAGIAAVIVLASLGSRGVLRFAATTVAALAFAAPFLMPLWTRYRLKVLNPVPGNFVAGLDVEALLLSEVSLVTLLALVGVVHMLRRPSRPAAAVLLAWPLLAALASVWHHFRPALAPDSAEIAPVHHWYVQLSAYRSLAFGAGIGALGSILPGVLSRLSPRARAVASFGCAATAVVVLAPVVVSYPWDVDRGNFREKALCWQAHDGAKVSRWLRQNVPVDSVVLASPDIGTLWVGPSGRKTMLVDRVFSNPFVDWDTLIADTRDVTASVESGDHDRFLALADRIGFTHAVFDGPSFGWISRIREFGMFSVYAVEWPWSKPGMSRVRILAPPKRGRLSASEPPTVAMDLPGAATRVAVTFAFEIRGEWFPMRYELPCDRLRAGEAGARTFTPSRTDPTEGAIPGLTWGNLAARIADFVDVSGGLALRGRVKIEATGGEPEQPVGASLPREFALGP